MKKSIKTAVLTLALGLGIQGAVLLQAEDKTAPEEPRMSSSRETGTLKSMDEFSALKKGDKIVIFDQNKRGTTTVISSADEKGLAKWNATKNGNQLDGTNLILKRKDNSREVETLSVQPDGTLTPVEVRRAQ